LGATFARGGLNGSLLDPSGKIDAIRYLLDEEKIGDTNALGS
jgi:hypothetical protein